MIKKLMKSIREYKAPSLITPLFIAFEVIIECIMPFLTANLIAEIQSPNCSVKTISNYGIALVVLAAASLCCGAVAGHFASVASCGFAKNLRHDLFYKIQNFSFSNIDKFSTSSLVTRLTTDIANVQMSYMMIIRTAIRSPLMLIFSTTMAVVVGGKLALAFAITIPILGIGLFLIAKYAMPIFRKVFKKYDNLNNSVQENVNGMRVVKSFVRADFEKDKFSRASDEVCEGFTKAEKILALNNPLMNLCIHIVVVIVTLFGAQLAVEQAGIPGGFQVGDLSALLTYSIQILSSLMMLSMIFVIITMSVESARRIVEVLDEESTIKNPENPVMKVENGDISFNNVSFKYNLDSEKYALSDININIKSGETIGIIGGTGSSKSSLVQLISRLYDATEGEVLVGGVDVRSYDIETLRNEVAVVLQKNVLFSGTIKDNLRWGNPDATDEEMLRVCKMAQADSFIQSFPDKYDTMITQGGTNVSGGQKQRLCIARALLKKPKILILDDSTSAVDTKTDALIRRAFAEEIPNTTKIIIAQRISSIEHADKIIVMEGGAVNAVGTHDELLRTNNIYQEVYNSQIKGGEDNE